MYDSNVNTVAVIVIDEQVTVAGIAGLVGEIRREHGLSAALAALAAIRAEVDTVEELTRIVHGPKVSIGQ
jgi:predicted translin family RNA/ssDNA-binding protein